MWAEVDPYDEGDSRTFRIVGTGFEVRDGLVYIGTVQMDGFVWHVYEEV